MQLTVTGKQVDIGDALRGHVAASLDAILGKYFGSAIEAHVAFAKDGHLVRTEVSVHIGRGIVVNGHAAAADFYTAFDGSAERIAKQLRRYKRRLHDHHARTRQPGMPSDDVEQARSYILAPLDDEPPQEPAEGSADETGAGRKDAEPPAPAVIAEITTELPSLTVQEAVMRMDLADSPLLLFRNRAHGELNLVYRRPDGNIGWIDPELAGRDRQRRDQR